MKYKYKIGQKVKYTVLDSKEDECKYCGHTETDYIKKKVTGKIIKRSYELLFGFTDFPITNDTEIINGKKVHKPYMSDIKPAVPEPYYEIKRTTGETDSTTEDNIKLR